mgnify:CR=1 FL=1
MISASLAVLGPEVKSLLVVFAIVGPMAIGILLFIIKRIEKENPDRIRWR